MAAKTYKLKINKSDGTYVETASFTIPDTAGTYSLTLTLSDGSTINAGTFTTPATAQWRTVWTGSETVAAFSFKGEQKGTKTVTLTNETLAGADWSRPTKITGVATATSGGISGSSNSKDILSLELIDGKWVHLVDRTELHKGSIDMSIIRNASAAEVVVSATCERLVTGAGLFFANLLLTKVEQYY